MADRRQATKRKIPSRRQRPEPRGNPRANAARPVPSFAPLRGGLARTGGDPARRPPLRTTTQLRYSAPFLGSHTVGPENQDSRPAAPVPDEFRGSVADDSKVDGRSGRGYSSVAERAVARATLARALAVHYGLRLPYRSTASGTRTPTPPGSRRLRRMCNGSMVAGEHKRPISSASRSDAWLCTRRLANAAGSALGGSGGGRGSFLTSFRRTPTLCF